MLSDIPTFRELWDGAALFFAPRDAEALAGGDQPADADDRAYARRAGPTAARRAARYTLAAQATAMRRRSIDGSPRADRQPHGGGLTMRFLFYTHSLVSDWNHGNAHFLRGVMRELQRRATRPARWSPSGGWSREQPRSPTGRGGGRTRFTATFPMLQSEQLRPRLRSRGRSCDGADVVVVHEWTDPALVARIGRRAAAAARFTLLFHDTHHRAVSAPRARSAALDLSGYDGVLAFGESLRRALSAGPAGAGRSSPGTRRPTTRCSTRIRGSSPSGDLIWVGNWGDGERSAELDGVPDRAGRARLACPRTVRGVRYPDEALERLADAGIDYGGWIANADVPAAFARHA